MIYRIQLFVWLVIAFSSCDSPSKSNYIEEEFCNIIRTLVDKQLMIVDTIHNKYVIIEPVIYSDRAKSLNNPVETLLNPNLSTRACQDFLFLDADTDLINDEYYRVYEIYISRYPDRDDYDITIRGVKNTHSKSQTMQNKKGKWILSDDYDYKYEPPRKRE